jgi:deoxyuridine 5'-triphosphate nucleotidohydrolase
VYINAYFVTKYILESLFYNTMPPRVYGQIASHSSLALKNQVDIKAGVIDPDYQGEIKVILDNTSTEPFQIDPQKAIAQILFLPIMNLIVKSTTFRNDNIRGSRGFRYTDSQGFFSEENSHIESNSIEVEM